MNKKKRNKRKQKVSAKRTSSKSPKLNPIRLILIFSFLILVLGGLSLAPTIQNEFINYDDPKLIYENPLITKSPTSTTAEVFSEFLYTPYYKPLVFLTWIWEYRINGPDPLIFHRNNLLLHLLNSLLVFFVFIRILALQKTLYKLRFEIGFIIALLFAVHPLHVESVAWAVERKDVLYTFFFMGSLLAYIQSWYSRTKIPWIILSGVLFFASLLSKSPAIVLPFILIILDWLKDRKFSFSLLKGKYLHLILFVIASYLYGLMGNFAEFTSGISEGIISSTANQILPSNLHDLPNFYQRIALVNTRLWLFILHLILPLKLSIIYPRYDIVKSIGVWIHLFPLLSLFLFYFVFKLRKSKPAAVFGILFFLINILPVLAMSGAGSNFLSDRYTYIASLGIFYALLVTVYESSQKLTKGRSGLIRMAFVFILVIFAIGSYNRSKTWKNSETIWSDVISKYPGRVWDAYNSRGNFYKNSGRNDLALSDMNMALQIDESHLSYNNRAGIYKNLGQIDNALEDLNRAIEMNNAYAGHFVNRGSIYFEKQQMERALADYNRALQLRPNDVTAYSNRSSVYAALGRYDEALQGFAKAEELDPFFHEIFRNRSLLYYEIKNFPAAIEDCNKAISIKPDIAVTYNLRGLCYQGVNQHQLAINDFDQAVRLNSNFAPYYFNRARSHDIMTNYAIAYQDLQKAVSLGYRVEEGYMQRLFELANQ